MHNSATFNPRHQIPVLIRPGHFHTRPGYHTVRDNGTSDWLIICTAEGSGRIGYRSGEFTTQPGTVVLWPPLTFHDYGIAANCPTWEILWAHFMPRPHWHPLLRWEHRTEGIYRLELAGTPAAAMVTEALAGMVDHASGGRPTGSLFAMNALERALLWCSDAQPRAKHRPTDPRIEAAADYLCRNSSRKLVLAEAARACALSESRLSHLFRDQMGLTPMQYLERHRLSRARELLELTPLSVTEVADMVGFESPFYFSRRFSASTGMSPSAYRARALSSPATG